MSDVLKWLQNMANEEWEYEDGDYALEAIKFFNSLRAENERLREALNPLAKAIKGQIADILFGEMPDNSTATVILQLGDLRRASAALEGSPK